MLLGNIMKTIKLSSRGLLEYPYSILRQTGVGLSFQKYSFHVLYWMTIFIADIIDLNVLIWNNTLYIYLVLYPIDHLWPELV